MKAPYFLGLCCALLLLALTHANAQEVRIWIPGWQATEPLNTPRAGSAIIESNGVIYAIGGIDGKDFLNTTEYSQIQDSGHLSPWQAGSTLNEPRGFFGAISHKGYIYAVGGGNGPSGHNLLRSVERAKILTDGSLGKWEKQKTSLNLPRRCVKLSLINNRIYAFGGFGGTLLDTIESAPILDNGHLGEWRVETNKLLSPRYVHAGKKTNNSMIITGGHNEHQGEGLNSVEWASLSDKNSSLSWQSAPNLSTGRYGHNAIVMGDYIYALGGLERINYVRSIEKSKVDPATGKPGEWRPTNPLSVALANFGVITYKQFIYVLGGTNQDGYYNHVELTSVNDNGDIGFWGNKKQAGQYERWEHPKRQATSAITLEHYGIVIESVAAGSYVYLHVETPSGTEWIAGEANHYPVNSEIEYSGGAMMHNFHSGILQRTFERIRFVSKINLLSSAHSNQPQLHSH